MHKHHIIYKTTCKVSGKWYVGMHSTNDLEDDYMGSGQLLLKSLKKHGRKNHTRDVLEHLNDREALSIREAELITNQMRADPMCMNLGYGGAGAKKCRTSTEETRRKLSEAGKRRWADKAKREEHALKIKEHFKKPGAIEAASKASQASWASSDKVKRVNAMAEGQRAYWSKQ